jgi:hypothetical protein
MKAQMFVVFALALTGASAQTDPLNKVYELMANLEAKIVKEGEEEDKAYKNYFEWCDESSANLANEIKTGEAKAEELEATIAECDSKIVACDSKIEDLSAAVATDQKELKDATEVRHKEEKTFVISEKELMDATDTLGRAIDIIGREMEKNPGAFVQVNTKSIDNMLQGLQAVMNAAAFSADDQSKLTALVQQSQNSDSDDDEPGAPAASVYKSHSGSLMEVLEDMKEKAETQLSDLRKAEATSEQNYKMLKQSLEDSMGADAKDLEEEKSLKAATEEAKASATGDLSETTKELASDKEALKNTQTECMQVATDHENTERSRKEELKAIHAAEKILKESTGGAAEQTYSFLQLTSRTELKNAEVVQLVKKLAREHHSTALAQLASRIKAVLAYGANKDVFAKVTAMITDMIAKLEAQAKEEATEKAYCDEEMSKTEEKKSELEAVIGKLTSKIDLAAAKSAELKQEVKQEQEVLANIAKEQAEMDNINQEQNAAYKKAKAELEQGIAGVQKAITVLRDYYGGDSSFVQNNFDAFMQQPAKPKKFVKSEGAGGSIIDILEVTESDFTKNLASEETEHEDNEANFEKETQENKVRTTEGTQAVKYKTQEYTALDKSVAELSADREGEETELSAVNEYYAKIKDRCVAKPETYEERKARREEEINGLKEALNILETETAFLQKGRRHHQHFLA